MGDRLLGTRRSPPSGFAVDDFVDSQLAYQWATSVQNLLARVFGEASEHYKNFKAQVEQRLRYSPANQAQGVLRAAREDYANGHLFELRCLIEAEVFDDFLEHAEHLLSSGYHHAAAVIGGCVLEDGLRRLCDQRGIATSAIPKLDTMNSDLAKAGVLTKLEQKKVTALADLRNKAAHGRWKEFEREDVEEMLGGVRRFMERHLS